MLKLLFQSIIPLFLPKCSKECIIIAGSTLLFLQILWYTVYPTLSENESKNGKNEGASFLNIEKEFYHTVKDFFA